MDAETSTLSPEARRERVKTTRGRMEDRLSHMKPGPRAMEILKRVFNGTFNDGFIHAGNLAFLSLLTLFPFFITVAGIAGMVGQTAYGADMIDLFLDTVPGNVRETVEAPIDAVLTSRAGGLVWLAVLFGLWSISGFIETIREILRRAYGTVHSKPFYAYRLYSIGLVIGSVALALVAFASQVVLTGATAFIDNLLPRLGVQNILLLSRLVPAAALFLAMYLMFYSLTPARYRARRYPKWPGALLTSVWWMATTALAPFFFSQLTSYDLTYGSLAGVMVALMFFFIIGLGVVVGGELNAALAEVPVNEIEEAEERADEKTGLRKMEGVEGTT